MTQQIQTTLSRIARGNIGLNPARMLIHLAAAPGGEAPQESIRADLGMGHSLASKTAGTLAEAGYIAARQDPDNRAKSILRITASGKAISSTLLPP